MRARTSTVLMFAGMPGLALAQILSGTAASHSWAQVGDQVGYTPSVGGPVTVENYFGASNGVPNASALANHAFSNVLIPGAGGLTSGSDSASVINSLTNGLTSAVYSAQVSASGGISSTVSGVGSDREVEASASATGNDIFDFTLSSATDLSLAGQANLVGIDPNRVQLVLTDLISNKVLFVGGAGPLSADLILGSGSYSLTAIASIGAGFDFNAFQGVLQNSTGPFEADIDYSATFSAPSATPEPGTLALGVGCIGAALWTRRTRRRRLL